MSIVNGASSDLNQFGLGLEPQKEVKKGLDQEDFFRLILAQSKNQDPLDPQSSGDFIAQLAQFASVDGIQNMQKELSSLTQILRSNQAIQASALVGRQVVVPSSIASLTDTKPLSVDIKTEGAVKDLRVDVFNQQGELVYQQSLGDQAGPSVPFSFNGELSDGTKLQPGNYAITATGLVNGETKQFITYSAANVESVSMGGAGGEISINVAGFGVIPLSQVTDVK